MTPGPRLDLVPIPPSTNGVIRVSRPTFSSAEVRAVARVLASGEVGGNGPIGREVERLLAKRLNARRVLLLSSCTHAYQAGLQALGIGKGDEVIMPSFSYMSMANAVLNVGARPVFVDVEPDHLTIDPVAANRAVTRRTKAILAVHYAGYPCQMDALLALKRRYELAILEDAAQAIGSTYRGRALGTIGEFGCLSFHQTKNIVCGEGGAFVTQRVALADRVDLIREKGTNRSAFLRGKVGRYEWIAQGDNYVLSELQAAILREQLLKLDILTARRRRLGLRYVRWLRPLEQRGRLRLPPFRRPEEIAGYNWHFLYVMVEPPGDRNRVIAQLRARNIEATTHFPALHCSPLGRQFHRGGSLPYAEAAAKRLMRIPLHAELSVRDQQRVVEALHEVLEGH
ncbi:MAG: dTDP-4-amino-4,6-dideoxygalactose transaminase [Candidatus Omnitrophica bacterium]|nr:dTDP-4-amino-4,6-dideoxygalactose transaminase [Candidatus Omnitrophota bacterium]MBI3021848.1 dTDP-4-amino-4,6-dideoxygalactose transaminase [Candidatus Omnitrophota bacterium]